MTWVTKYGYNPKRAKSEREYEKVFLQFMSYTNIRDINELTPDDLRYYFKQVDDHATGQRASAKPVFAGQDSGRSKLRKEMADALSRLQSKGVPIENPNVRRYSEARRHRSFTDAARSQDTIVYKDRRIFLDAKGRWRDHRGRYSATPYVDLRRKETKRKSRTEERP